VGSVPGVLSARSAILTVVSPSRPVAPPGAPVALGQVTLVTGPEELRRSRAVAEVVAGIRLIEPAAEVEHVDGAALASGALSGLVGPSLFAPARIVVVDGADSLGSDVADEVVELARNPEPECALILVHPGGNRGRALVDAVRRTGARVVTCERPRQGELPDFVRGEAARAGMRFARGADRALCDAVGGDLAAIAAAVGQLAEDLPEGATVIGAEHVATYYGGLADVSGFDVADALYGGLTSDALRKLRWALQANVAPVLLASALVTGARSILRLRGLPGRTPEAEIARVLGVPPWKIRSVREQARGWSEEAAGRALAHTAELDIAVKGGTTDPGFALELAVLRIGALHDAG
jgi:DNA polymerase-3 subunit delta